MSFMVVLGAFVIFTVTAFAGLLVGIGIFAVGAIILNLFDREGKNKNDESE